MSRVQLKFKAVDYDKFTDIKNGLKTIETRAATGTYRKIKMGDQLVIKCRDESIDKQVVRVEHFNSVREIYESPDFPKILPGVDSLEEAKKIYYGFTGYKGKISEHGILAFYLK